jgi:putative component of toxin-antitoxin plasmid stabilization module
MLRFSLAVVIYNSMVDPEGFQAAYSMTVVWDDVVKAKVVNRVYSLDKGNPVRVNGVGNGNEADGDGYRAPLKIQTS